MVPEHETTERQKYEKQIIAEFSSLLNIEKDRFKIRSIKAGSVIIDFSILPSGKGDDMPAQEAMELLSKHISNPQSNLFSSSNFPILKAVNAAKSLSGGKLPIQFVSMGTAIAATTAAVINAAQSAMDNAEISHTENEKLLGVEETDDALKQNIIPEEKNVSTNDEDTQISTIENLSNDVDVNEDKGIFDIILMQAYINVLSTKYDIQSNSNITIEDFTHLMKDITDNDKVTKEDCMKVFKKIHEKTRSNIENIDSVDKSQFIVSLNKFVEMNDDDKANYTKDNTLSSFFIDFVSKLDTSYTMYIKGQMKSYEPFVIHLWEEFANSNNSMAEKDIATFLEDITEKESIPLDVVRSFILKVQNCDPTDLDSHGKYEISKNQLCLFVLKTIHMNKLNESFENEEQPLRSIISEFSVGLASEMEHFKQVDEAKNADPFRESEVVAFVDSIWHKYDSDESGSIDAKETKQMIEDITKSQNSISIELCQKFLESVTGRGHQNNTSDVKILKNNLLDLVHDGIAMTSKEREEYAKSRRITKNNG